MQNVFGRNGFLANPALGECEIFRNSRIEVMGDHHHIEGLVKRIYGVWSGWSCRRWNDVWFATDFNDVRGVSAARPFSVKRVNGSALECGDRIFDETAFVEGVCVDKNLNIHVIRDRQAAVNGRGCCAPILMKLEAACAGLDLLNETCCRTRVALSVEAEVHREGIGGLEHPPNMPRTWSTGGCIRPYCRSRPAAHHRGQARIESFFDLLRANVMDVRVDAAGGDNLALAGDHFSSGADYDRDVRLDIRIPSFPDRCNPAVFDCDICLHDSPMIENQGVRNYRVDRAFTARTLGLTHAVANHLPAAELHLLAVGRVVLFYFDDDVRIRKAYFVTDGWSKHLRIGSAVHFVRHLLFTSKAFPAMLP